jgi:rhamnosyltransferase
MESSVDFPSVSVIFLTRNGMPRVAEALHAVLAQDYPGPLEIRHIDTASTDDTCAVFAKAGIPTQHIQPHEFHHAATRNQAARDAGHEIVVFLSQDAVPSGRHWLRALVSPFREPDVAAAWGRQIPPAHVRPLRAWMLRRLYPETPERRSVPPGRTVPLQFYRFSNANAAYRRTVLLEHPFPESAPICEDQGMCGRLLRDGFTVCYVPEAAVYHGHDRTWREEWRWAVDNGYALKRLGILSGGSLGREWRYGFSRVREDLRSFVREVGITSLPSYGALLAIRWFGVQVGKRADRLPRWFLRFNSEWIPWEWERAQARRSP